MRCSLHDQVDVTYGFWAFASLSRFLANLVVETFFLSELFLKEEK